jgi:cobalt-zinc-cadmium efflux system outer membrane protein
MENGRAMGCSRGGSVWAARGVLAALAWVGAAGPPARAQGPAEILPPPELPSGASRLGRAPGALGASLFGQGPGQADRPLGGRAGPSSSRAPVGGLIPPALPPSEPPPRFRPPALEPAEVPQYGELETPAQPEAPGATGLSLDDAIGVLLRQNLALLALRYEVPMARADLLTAGLRNNPIFYADSQLIPYQSYGNRRPGGQTQYDINVTFPIDVTGKRRARMAVAARAADATEAQLQDAVRLQIDNLYTLFIDVVAARETLRFSEAFLEGITRILELNEDLLRQGQITPSVVDALRVQRDQARLQVREAREALATSTLALAVLLNIPRAEAEALQVRSVLRELRELPAAPEALIQQALSSRPDLIAYRIGVLRADAELGLARANRYPDIYLLYQPYTFQDNAPFGTKSAHSWAVGLTATMPVFNRNQGNIQRAELNRGQTRVELAELERRAAHEVEAAIREFQLSRVSVLEFEREILPSSRRVRDTAYRQFQGGQASVLEYLEAQRAYNDVVRRYRDALVRHRRSALDLNTSVGARVLP